MRFSITVAGDVQLDRDVEAIGRHAAGIDQVLHEIAADLDHESELQFASEGAHSGSPWPPLTEKYRERKARMILHGKIIAGRPARYMQILRLTDRLRLSLINRDDPEHVERIVDHQLEWGTSVPYARFHQNPGTSSRAMPQRRYLELSELKRQEYARAMLTFIRTGKSGLVEP